MRRIARCPYVIDLPTYCSICQLTGVSRCGQSRPVSDLIGTKRPSHARSLRSWVVAASVLLIGLSVTYLLYRRVSSYAHPSGSAPKHPLQIVATAPERGLPYGPASLRYQGPLGILQTSGSAHDIGAQQGRLLASEIQRVQAVFLKNVQQTVSADGLFGESLHNIRLRWRWRTLDDGIPGHQLGEIAGLVRGARKSDVSLGYEDQVRLSAILDVGQPASGSSGAEMWTLAKALTLLVPTSSPVGQRLVVARSVSLPGSADGGEAVRDHPILHVAHPTDALAYASLAWPGLVGVISGVNQEGVGVFLHFAKTSDVRLTREAQPSALIAQELLERARTLDEAINILKKAKSLGSAIYVIVDGNERSWAVVERSPSIIDVRRGEGSAAIVDNLIGSKFKDDAINDRSRRTRPMLLRQARAKLLLKKPRSTEAEVAEMLRDRKSKDGATLVFGHRAALDDTESVQTALFDVSGLVLWVSDSGDASGTFRAIDLRHELLGQGLTGTASRAAPPADIPSSDSHRGARKAIRSARHQIMLARRARDNGKMRRAREHAAAALSRAPTLPEALLVAGELAKEAGDELDARALLQRYLEVGADDLRSIEQVEAWLGAR